MKLKIKKKKTHAYFRNIFQRTCIYLQIKYIRIIYKFWRNYVQDLLKHAQKILNFHNVHDQMLG